TKNLTTHLSHNLCAVLPKAVRRSLCSVSPGDEGMLGCQKYRGQRKIRFVREPCEVKQNLFLLITAILSWVCECLLIV
ncbi:MAG: hypothetical protein ACLR7O_00550, partial [Ruminococcus callidus]